MLTGATTDVDPDERLLRVLLLHLAEMRCAETQQRVPAAQKAVARGVIHCVTSSALRLCDSLMPLPLTVRLARVELGDKIQSLLGGWAHPSADQRNRTYAVEPLLLIRLFLANRPEEAHPRENQVRAQELP